MRTLKIYQTLGRFPTGIQVYLLIILTFLIYHDILDIIKNSYLLVI